MNKTKKTKEILKEWRKFESKEKVNESQTKPPAPLKRIKYVPTQAARDLHKELEDFYGKDTFNCYDYFDQFGDEDMIHLDDGYQIEFDSITDHTKKLPGFPSNISTADIVWTNDDQLSDRGSDPRKLQLDTHGHFNIIWPVGPFKGSKQNYGYGEIDINGRKQKVVHCNPGGVTLYYMFPDDSSAVETSGKEVVIQDDPSSDFPWTDL